MYEGVYTVELLDRKIDIKVTHYLPEVLGVHDQIPENCYPTEPEELEYEAHTNNPLLNHFLNECIFDTYGPEIYKQLAEHFNSA